jgi:hypothetical protein
MSNGHHIYWPGKHSVLIEQSVKFNTDADIFLLNSVPLKGEQVPKVPKVTSNPEQPTVQTTIPKLMQPMSITLHTKSFLPSNGHVS